MRGAHAASAPAIKSETSEAAGTASLAAAPKNGSEVFQQACSACHGAGIAGAPRAGQGKGGVMAAKGGRADLPDELVKQGVDYMLQLAQ